jgi:uncharacterized protein (TIGR02646 family)
MEKINKKPLAEVLQLNHQTSDITALTRFTLEFENKQRPWQSSGSVYLAIKYELGRFTIEHCSFCDGFPLDETTPATIEHYHPKNDYPLQIYEWNNLFYCCSKCQSQANKIRPFRYTLKPDDTDYSFDRYFYFDVGSGEIKVLENLEQEDSERADNFLTRYGIISPKRNQARKDRYKDYLNNLKAEDNRPRDTFPYRYVYDEAVKYFEAFIM